MKSHILFLLLLIFLLTSGKDAFCQPFNLFSRDRSEQHPAPARIEAPVKRNDQAGPKLKTTKFVTKKFILKGTAILGSKRYAILKEVGQAENIVLRQDQGRTVPIPGDPRYQLDTILPRQVRIRYPITSPCTENDPQNGIKCIDDGKFAQLTIVRAAAVASSEKKSPAAIAVGKKNRSNIIGTFPDMKPPEKKKQSFIGALVNESPEKREEARKRRLAQLQKDKAYKKRKQQYRNFKPRRIKEEDIPPGMKVMTTPFGDILVPN